MTTSLKIIALFSLAALSSAAAAETAGLSIPAFASAEAALSLFVIATAFLTFGHDYRRRATLNTRDQRTLLLPASEAFHARRARAVSRRERSRRTFKPTAVL